MRWLALVPVLLLCGCRLPGHLHCGPPPCDQVACAPDCVPCPPPPCPPQRVQINLHREKEKPPPPEQPKEVREQPRPQQVAQEVILVPRTVYMPFAAQTPTAPVRMIGVAPLMQPCEQPPGPSGLKKPEDIKKQEEAPAPKKVKECTLEELQERLQNLESLLQRIEAIVPNGATPAAVTLSSPRTAPETAPPAIGRPLSTRPEPNR